MGIDLPADVSVGLALAPMQAEAKVAGISIPLEPFAEGTPFGYPGTQ